MENSISCLFRCISVYNAHEIKQRFDTVNQKILAYFIRFKQTPRVKAQTNYRLKVQSGSQYEM